jgi:hypothetical protein
LTASRTPCCAGESGQTQGKVLVSQRSLQRG